MLVKVWSSSIAIFDAAGSKTNTMDIFPKHASHVAAIKNSISLFFAFMSPNFASFLQDTTGNTPFTWATIFSFSGGMMILGNLSFILYADDRPPDWARDDTEHNLL